MIVDYKYNMILRLYVKHVNYRESLYDNGDYWGLDQKGKKR